MRIIDAERWISELEAQMDAEGCPWEIQEYNLMLINEIQARINCIDEESENKGKLLKLPCAVGDTVYAILPHDSHLTKAQINKIEIKPTIYGKMCYFIEPVSHRGHLYRYFGNDFGKTVFLTREEAEAALKNM